MNFFSSCWDRIVQGIDLIIHSIEGLIKIFKLINPLDHLFGEAMSILPDALLAIAVITINISIIYFIINRSMGS